MKPTLRRRFEHSTFCSLALDRSPTMTVGHTVSPEHLPEEAKGE